MVKRWLCIGLILILGGLLGLTGYGLWDKPPLPLERVAWSADAQWIGPTQPTYRFYARRNFEITEMVDVAWLRLSVDNDFILYVNGTKVLTELSVVNNGLGITRKLSTATQRLNLAFPYRSLDSPEVVLEQTKDWRMAVYIDITPFLSLGQNVIAVEVQKSQQNPRFVLEGQVDYISGESIDLTTGANPWYVSNLSESNGSIHWYEPTFSSLTWPEAKPSGPVSEATYSRLSPSLFNRRLSGYWLSGVESEKGEVWLRGTWPVDTLQGRRGFVRFASPDEYALSINGFLVNASLDRDLIPSPQQLPLYEVTHLLKRGINTIAVRLARPLSQDSQIQTFEPLKFYLDGWLETPDQQVESTIVTDENWVSLSHPQAHWFIGEGEGQGVLTLNSPNPRQFIRTYNGDAYVTNYWQILGYQGLWLGAGIGFIVLLAWLLGRLWLERPQGFWPHLTAGTALLFPSALYLIGMGLLQHRYAEAEVGFLFAKAGSLPAIALGFISVLLLTLVASREKRSLGLLGLGLYGLMFSCTLSLLQAGIFTRLWSFLGLGCIGLVLLVGLLIPHSRLERWPVAIVQLYRTYWPIWGQWFGLGIIVVVGFVLRVYNLEFPALQGDENVSWDATRGILRTGVPESASGIWYTRSPAYHYLLALWLRILGDSLFNARLLSVFWGTATLVIVFFLARKVTGKVWIALVVTAILAIDPWELMLSRFIRFYQVVQFMSLTAILLVLKGFVYQEGKRYQHYFYIVVTLAILSQEVTITLLPSLFLGFLCFYRPFRLSDDWSIPFGSFMVILITAFDLIFFSIKCLTAWIALSPTTDSIIRPHLLNVTVFALTFFVGFNRMHIIYTFFFFGGFIYFLIKRKTDILLLYSIVFFTLFSLTILVQQIAYRYTYNLYPLFIIVSVYSAVCIMESLGHRFQEIIGRELPFKKIALLFTLLLLVFNLETGRVLAGFHNAIFSRNTSIFQYIYEHKKPGDVVISTAPFGAAIQLGGIDYFLPEPIPFDALYWRDGRVVDRWAGGVLISNLDQLTEVLEKSERVWLHLDDYKTAKFRLSYLDYFETLGQPIFESFGTRLRLWQKKDGKLPWRIPNTGQDLGAY